MKTIRIKLYEFEELSDKAKQYAIADNYDINHDGWYDSTYEDAREAFLEIEGFDIERGSYCNIEFIKDAEASAKYIVENHGETCKTSKIAKEYLDRLKIIKDTTPVVTEDGYEDYSEREDLIEEADKVFQKSLEREYLRMLREQYEYETSDEAITETLTINNYYFTETGNRFHQPK